MATTTLVQTWNASGISDSLWIIEAFTGGRSTDTAAPGACASWKVTASFHIDGGGAVSQVGDFAVLSSQRDHALRHDYVFFDVSGTTIRLMCVSQNNYSMTYGCSHSETLI